MTAPFDYCSCNRIHIVRILKTPQERVFESAHQSFIINYQGQIQTQNHFIMRFLSEPLSAL